MAEEVRVLVPLRSIDGPGKTRLAGLLDAPARRELVLAMFFDVVDTLRSAGLDDVVVLAGDGSAARAAEECGCQSVVDQAGRDGLSDIVADARRRVALDADVLVVMPDLPALGPGEVQRLVGSAAPVAIAPTDDGGTGGLLLRRRVSVALRFGPQSAAHHAVACLEAGLSFEWSRSSGFGLDVDTPHDLGGLTVDRLGPATAHLLGLPLFRRALAPIGRQRASRRPTSVVPTHTSAPA